MRCDGNWIINNPFIGYLYLQAIKVCVYFREKYYQITTNELKLKTRLTLKPGQYGTKSLVKKYGDDLICVRFRYDAKSQQRIKTVELVIERSPWTPPP